MSIEVLKQIWPEWHIEGPPLGEGTFGVVYKAVRRDHHVESYAAIKVIPIPSKRSEIDSLRAEGFDAHSTKDFLEGIVNDFVNEIQLMETLKGIQNIVSVEDYHVIERTNEIGWDIYIRMELLTPFHAHISDKKLSEKEVIKLGGDICTALQICTKRNIIHRDIKPENIFINDFGDYKLGDFGIARKMENLSGGLSQKGTLNYMAPEVATSNSYDARVDIYSLGIVLYRLLNRNRLPFLETDAQIKSPNERRNAVDRRLRGEKLPAPSEASAAMADVILRACAFDANMRFTSASEMKQALNRVADGTYQIPADDQEDTLLLADRKKKNKSKAGSDGTAPKKKLLLPIAIAIVVLATVIAGTIFVRNYQKKQEDITSIATENNAYDNVYDANRTTNAEKETLGHSSSNVEEEGSEVPTSDAEDETPESSSSSTEEEPFKNPFSDVTESEWYYDHVMHAAQSGLIIGFEDGTFSPDSNLTRAEWAMFLYRLCDTPSVKNLRNPFNDLVEDWYQDAVIYLASIGVTHGTSEGKFEPDQAIMREEMVTMLYRLSETTTTSENLSAAFADGDFISDWAVDAMNWAIATKIIEGHAEDNTLEPQGFATRAQAAKVVTLFAKLVN